METVASWQGVGASGGRAEGRAHLLLTDTDLAHVPPDAILVARHATLSILPAFLTARAAICENGGYLGHLAILARELGKPCVTGLPGLLPQLRPGERLRLDGGTGRVERLPGNAPVKPTGTSSSGVPEHVPLGWTPVLQFGEFSATFEPRPAAFTLDLALRTAALVGLPSAFVREAPLVFEVTERHVLVETLALRALTERLADRFEEGRLDAAKLREGYQAAAGWEGWAALGDGAGAGLLPGALRRYAGLNRLTWLAALVKETLARRCRAWLETRWPPGSPARAQAVFLDLLTTPGRSYILRCGLGETSGCVWSDGPPAAGAVADLAGRAGPLLGDARERQRRALAALGRHLDPREARRARWFVETLADLMDLTERKNTDLHRAGHALFTGPDLPTLSALCGLPAAPLPGGPEECRRWVERCLEATRESAAPAR